MARRPYQDAPGLNYIVYCSERHTEVLKQNANQLTFTGGSYVQ
jgi:hypothetical protein